MASDLLELTRQIQQAPIIGAGLADSLIGSYRKGQEIEQARRDMEAQQQLRALFARGQQPSMSEIGQYAPELAMKYNPMGLQNLKLQADIMKSRQQMEESAQKQEFERLNKQGQAVVPIIDAYHSAIEQGMPEPQAQERFRAQLGQLIPVLEQSGLGFKAGLTNNVTPEQLANVYEGYNVLTRKRQADLEQAKARAGEMGRNMVMPRMTPQQAWGGWVQMPNGQFIRQPSLNQGGGLGGGMSDMGDGMRGTGASVMMRLSDKQLTDLANNNKMPAEQQAAIAEIERRYPQIQTINEPSTGGMGGMGGMGGDLGITTPEQYQQNLIKQKADEAAAVEAAKLKTEEKQKLNKTIANYEDIPSIGYIEKLIDKSIGGDLEVGIDRALGIVGKSSPAGENTAALKVIAGQLKDFAQRMPGAVSDKDLQTMIDSVGQIDQPTAPEKRKKALRELISQIERRMFNRAEDIDITQQQAIKLVNQGKMSPETFDALQSANKWGGERLQLQTQSAPKQNRLRIGDIKDGHEYLGGDPNKEENWRAR